MPVRIVCFDLGGVLLQINHDWSGAAEAAGVPLGNAGAGRLVDFKPIDAYQGGEISFEDYLSQLSPYLGLTSVEAARSVHMSILRQEYPGVPELIGDLHDAGLETGILSNTSGPHWERMHTPSIFPGFNLVRHRVASHEAGCNKPAEAIYRAFESASGFSGDEIVFFDDYQANVDGARRLGWQAFPVESSGDTVLQMRAHLAALGVLPI